MLHLFLCLLFPKREITVPGDQSWVFFGRTDAKAETPILRPPHAKSWLIGKVPGAGRVWGQEQKGKTKDEMAGCHHLLDAHEFGWTLGVGDGQGGLACCDLWGLKESFTTEWLNWTEHCSQILYHLSHQGSAWNVKVWYIFTVYCDSPHECWYIEFFYFSLYDFFLNVWQHTMSVLLCNWSSLSHATLYLLPGQICVEGVCV